MNDILKYHLTIIIPVYNAEKTLERCIESIICQSKKNTEVILINDGSSDSSAFLCDKYANNYSFISVYHQENKGPSVARNLGIQKAKGKYIGFVDSDDSIAPNYINILQEAIVKYKTEIISFNYSKVTTNKIQKRNNGLIPDNYYEGDDIIDLFKRTSFTPFLQFVSPRIIKRDLISINQIKFDSEIRFGEDTLFNMRCYFFANSLYNISDSLYFYYDNEGSASSSQDWNSLVSNMRNHFNYRYNFYLTNPPLNKDPFLKDLGRYYIEHILFLMLSNNPGRTQKSLKESIRALRKMELFHKSFEYYKPSGKVTLKMQILISLFKNKSFWLMSSLYRLGLPKI
ncbi:glycosyltransferase family 2 protein [Robiginitalea sp. IMCC44478]|uniref:glycosyltransferase family 2 protein n=1 Tax=Robiginitalea sp. IMCC44478 TaxID=3459122 RepID=UPI004042CFBF